MKLIRRRFLSQSESQEARRAQVYKTEGKAVPKRERDHYSGIMVEKGNIIIKQLVETQHGDWKKRDDGPTDADVKLRPFRVWLTGMESRRFRRRYPTSVASSPVAQSLAALRLPAQVRLFASSDPSPYVGPHPERA